MRYLLNLISQTIRQFMTGSKHSSRRTPVFVRVLTVLAICVVVSTAFLYVRRITADTGSGAVSLTTLGSAVTENFDTLSNTAGSTTNITLPTGWYITETGGGARDNEQYAVDTGASNTGDIYSYGSAGSSDRALGALRSGTLIPLFGAKFTNTTGSTITSLVVSYTGEEWRLGTTARTDRIDFQISTDATDLSTGTYTDVNTLDFTTPETGTTGAKDGNAAAFRTAISATISGLNIPSGASFFIRWTDLDASGADDGLSVDDFSITPQGAGGGDAAPSVASTVPTNAATAIAANTNITVNFSEAVNATSGSFTISGAVSGTHTFALSGGPTSFALNPDTDFTAGELVTVTVLAAGVTDQDAIDPPDNMAANYVFSFTIAAPVTLTPIHTIQGAGFTSAFDNMSVTTSGIVTGRKSNGFFIQEPDASIDANPLTSEAIFVFTSTNPTVNIGDSVQVTGTVDEFRPNSSDEPSTPADPETLTEIVGPLTIVTLTTGNSLPAALNATSLGIFNPAATSRGAELEPYECMRLSVPSMTVSEPTNSFGEFWGVEPPRPRPFREPGIEAGDPIPAADEGPHAGSPPPNVPIFDGNFERIQVDTNDLVISFGPVVPRSIVYVTTGTVVTGVVGPLDYAFDNYRILLETSITPGTSGGVTAATPVPTRTSTEFTIAHANLENFGASNSNFAGRLNKASLAIRNVMQTPDILGVIEVYDLGSLQQLAAKINADAASPATVNYQAYLLEGVGGGGDDQDVGYLVNAARVTVVGTPVQFFAGNTFTFSGVTDILHDRPPYLLEADVPHAGGTIRVTVIVNHTKSLIGVDSQRPYNGGPATEGARNREKRRLQAEDIANLIQSRINDNLVVLGDLNAFDFNDGLTDIVGTMKGSPAPAAQVVEPSTDIWPFVLTNLLTTVPTDQRYSYAFEGNAQTLDHMLVNDRMLARNTRFAYARYNADFPESPSFAGDTNRPERLSDHDAPVGYFQALACMVTCPGNITTTAAAGQCGATVMYAAPTTTGDCGTVTCSPASGSAFSVGTTTVTCSQAGGSPSCSFTVTVTDNQNPTIGACPTSQVVSAGANCTATVTFATPSGTDNCGTPTVTCLPASGSSFALGVTTVTCTARDAANNSSSCSFTVTVNDTTAPTIGACPSSQVVSAGANCTATATFSTPSANDNCTATPTVTCSPASGSSFALGVTTVTCTARDAANNSSSCSFTVTVNDTTAPTIGACPTSQVVSAGANCTATATFSTPSANDNCTATPTVTCSPASGSSFALGVTTVTCTARDAANNSSSCSFTVTVNDTTVPTISCPGNQSAGSSGGAVAVVFPTPTAMDNCTATPNVTCNPASGSNFPVGVTTVSCTARDAANNQSLACTFTVTVTVNQFTPAPTVRLTDPLVCTGPGNRVNGSFAVTNTSQISQTGTITVALPAGLVGLPNSCTANVGACTVTANSVVWNGTLAAGQTITASYQAQVGDQVLNGTQLCAQTTAVFGQNTATVQACLTANCPGVGPGLLPSATSPVSDQKAGSILIYNIYTSSTDPTKQNTRINLTNTNMSRDIQVHLYFVAEGCSVADSYVCLTPNQTTSFVTSDFDPGTTGYIVAVATDQLGCPINFNYLIGDEYVKFATGHAANLGAQAISAIAGGLTACDQNSVIATLNFDGVSYNTLPRTLAASNIGSKADGNDAMLIVNRIGGNLGLGAASLGTIFGIFYDDAENAVSFTVTGGCQLRGSVSNNFPRTTPRFEQLIPAGRTGWFKLYRQEADIAMTGAIINLNTNSTSSAGAFNQGHNLHALTLSTAGSYVVPVFPPPGC